MEDSHRLALQGRFWLVDSDGAMPYKGWLQHVFVHTSGNVILSEARCCSSNLPILVKQHDRKGPMQHPARLADDPLVRIIFIVVADHVVREVQ